ncbi:MAG: 3-isopropylmalate dehydratase small subunit [Clostridia bacterium]|nr:3-isopropylmalate dehydratase small subunit [Clostridia bacterium]
MTIKGKAWKYGKNVDTDVIIPGRYCNIGDPMVLAKHCMEDLDPEFVNKISPGDIILADSNFGCGSSREVAPLCIKAAGISAVVAVNFARIFYRNSINIGLPIFECPEAFVGIDEEDEITIDQSSGIIKNLTKGTSFQAAPFPEFMQKIIAKGGLVAYAGDRLAELKKVKNQ